MVVHDLKILPEYFDAARVKAKTFEIRKNDRMFKVGDIVTLKEWLPHKDMFSGRYFQVIITYITDYEQKDGYVVFSFAHL